MVVRGEVVMGWGGGGGWGKGEVVDDGEGIVDVAANCDVSAMLAFFRWSRIVAL